MQRIMSSWLVFLSSVLLFVACTKEEKKPTGPVTEIKSGSADVVATIDGVAITDAEIRNQPKVKMNLYKANLKVFEAQQREHQTFIEALNERIETNLLERAAKDRGISIVALLKEEVENKAGSVSDAEAKSFYDERGINRPYESIKERIREHLQRQKQQERQAAYFSSLKKKYNVVVNIGEFSKPKPLPPRIDVDIDPANASMGPKNAKVTIVEFSDYQCPFCKRTEDTVKKLVKKYAGKIKLVFRHYPLPFHKEAFPAALAAECAKEQDKFWEYHDLLFENQRALAEDNLISYAKQLKLKEDPFKQCLTSKKFESLVNKDITVGKQLGVTGTPAFFINGRMLSGAKPIEEFEELIENELKGS